MSVRTFLSQNGAPMLIAIFQHQNETEIEP
jgi:hypothetical protein